MNEPVVVFGDVHGDVTSLEVILEEARRLGIRAAINLGDEERNPTESRPVYDALRRFRDDGNTLICVRGNHTFSVPDDLKRHYAGLSTAGFNNPASIFENDNVIAGHAGVFISQFKNGRLRSPPIDKPLMVFFGHSHSMCVLPEFRHDKPYDYLGFIEEGTRVHALENGSTYWVNPGEAGVYVRTDSSQGVAIYAANFAVYHPAEQTVALRSILHSRNFKW